MMYYCPCPCSDPVDPDSEEHSFLPSLTRNLSYVQESYLDAHSVSGRFVFNPRTERQIAAHTFSHDLRSGRYVWRPVDAAKVKAAADVDIQGENDSEEEEEEERGGWREAGRRLLAAVKAQASNEIPVTFTLDLDNSSTAQPCGNNTIGCSSSVSDVGNTTVVSSVPVPSVSTVTSPPVNSNPSAPTASFISRVTSLISPKDDSSSKKTDDACDLGSSVDAELTPVTPAPSVVPDPSEPFTPPLSVLRSPDHSGLTMDRGEDLMLSPDLEDNSVLICSSTASNDLELSDNGSHSASLEGPDAASNGNETDSDHREVPSKRTDKEISIDNGIHKNGVTSSTSDSCESPDSEAFSEEGVFVNVMDEDTDVTTTDNDKCASEVSDDTRSASVDSVLGSQDDSEAGGDEIPGTDESRRMSIQEAISRAAVDLDKMTEIMYPGAVGGASENTERLPSTINDWERRSKSLPASRDSPLRALHGLRIEISQHRDTSGSESRQEPGDPKESPVYEDNEFNFNKKTLRKSSSLKTNKTPPGTPHRKKVVRFADAMGLDLESVRHVLNTENPPKVPASAMADLNQGLGKERADIGNRYLMACFEQPGAVDTFVQTVLAEKVKLENAIITNLTITGFIRVANVSYHKSVRVRYTHNGWATFHDIAAVYLADSCDGITDRFSFSIVAPAHFVAGDRLMFAVSFNADGTEFWDNNRGENYTFECFAKTVPTENDREWLHFL